MQSDVTISVLNLDVEAERVKPQEDTPGYLRCEKTFSFRVKKEIVRGATVDKVTPGDPSLTASFVEAAKKLEARGVKAIAGDCGFIASYQRDMAKAVSVPVVSSSLILVPLVYRMLPAKKKVGILTANSEKLGEKHFNGVGWSRKDIPIAVKGMDELPPEARARFGQYKSLDPAAREKDFVGLAKDLVKENPDVGAIVIECTVIPPFTRAIQKATGLPVFDITIAARLAFEAVSAPDYSE